MQRRPYVLLDKHQVLKKRFFIPTSLIERFELYPLRRPHQELLDMIQPAISTSPVALHVALNDWNLSVVFDASNESFHIEFLQESKGTLMKDIDKYKLLVEAADDFIYETNMNGEFTYVNPKAVSVTGFKREELLGMKYLDLIREDWRDRAREFYRDQFAETKKTTYMELPLSLKNGAEIWVGQNVQLLESAHGVFGTMAIARDITSRYEMHSALEVSEEKYRSIIQNLQFGLMEVDLNGNIVFVNDSMLQLTGYSRGELLGENAESLFLDEHQKRVINDEHVKRQKGIPSAYAQNQVKSVGH